MYSKNPFAMSFNSFRTNRVIYKAGENIPFDFYPKENWLIRAILWRRTKKQNTFILITGEPRTSKSYFCLKICERIGELLDRQFDVEKQLTMNDIVKFFTWSKTSEYSEFIIDEIGSELSTTQFWSIVSSVMRVYTMCQGFRGNAVFMVLPYSRTLQKYFKCIANYGIKTINQGKVSVYKRVMDTLNDSNPIFISKRWIINFSEPKDYIKVPYETMKKEFNDLRLVTDIDVIQKINETNSQKAINFQLRQKSLELGVKLKEFRIEQIQKRYQEISKYE